MARRFMSSCRRHVNRRRERLTMLEVKYSSALIRFSFTMKLFIISYLLMLGLTVEAQNFAKLQAEINDVKDSVDASRNYTRVDSNRRIIFEVEFDRLMAPTYYSKSFGDEQHVIRIYFHNNEITNFWITKTPYQSDGRYLERPSVLYSCLRYKNTFKTTTSFRNNKQFIQLQSEFKEGLFGRVVAKTSMYQNHEKVKRIARSREKHSLSFEYFLNELEYDIW